MSIAISPAILATRPRSRLPVIALVVGMASTARAAAPMGHVSYVTKDYAFLEKGLEDGVHLGDVLTFQETRKTCKVDVVSEHYARCAGTNLPRNGRFAIRHAALTAQLFERRSVPKPMSHERIKEVRSTLSAAPFERVGTASLSAKMAARGYASLNHDAYIWIGQPRSVQGERLEIAARVAPLSSYRQLVAALRMTALYWTQQTMPLRFDGGAPGQFYLHQGDVSWRGRRDRLTFAVGRTLAWNAPGLAVLDGAQVGYKSREDTYEIGAFGGLIPFPGLGANTGHVTAGLYGMAQGALAKGLLRGTGRLAYVQTAGAAPRLEMEARAEMTYGARLQVGVTPRIGYNLQSNAISLDAVRADVATTPIDRLHVAGTLRYATGLVDIYSQGIVAPPDILRTTYFSTISAMYQFFTWMGIGTLNVIDHDNTTGQQRIATGPQLSFPGLFGHWGDLSGTFLYELTAMPGTVSSAYGVPSPVPAYGNNIQTYSGFVQASFSPRENVNTWLRVAWLADAFQLKFLQQLGYYAHVEAALLPWLGVAGFVRVNEALPNPLVFLPLPVSIAGNVQLVAHL